MTVVCSRFWTLFSAAHFDLVGFFCICCNTPTVEACMQKSHLPVQHNRQSKTGAKQKVTLKSLRKPNVLFYNTNRSVGLKCTRSLRLLLFTFFFFISKVEQSPRVWFKQKNQKALALFQADSFDSFQMSAMVTAHVSGDSNHHQFPRSTECRWPFQLKRNKTKNVAMVREK